MAAITRVSNFIMANQKKRLLIADDHPIFRQGLKQLLASIEWLHIVAEAENGCSALSQIKHFRPDIIILDLAMPDMDGLTVLQRTREEYPNLITIILTSYDDSAYVDRAFELGANAYVVKDSAGEDLINCLEVVVQRKDVYISPSLGSRFPELPPTATEKNTSLDSLTKMERKILSHVARFLTSKEIGKELGVSYRTVQNHRSSICSKLHLKGAHQLLSFAREYFDQ